MSADGKPRPPTFNELRDLPLHRDNVVATYDHLPETYYRLRKATVFSSGLAPDVWVYVAYAPSLLEPYHEKIAQSSPDCRFFELPWNYTPTGEVKLEPHITAADLERHAVLWSKARRGKGIVNHQATQTDVEPVLQVLTQTTYALPSMSTQEIKADPIAVSEASTQATARVMDSSSKDASTQSLLGPSGVFPGSFSLSATSTPAPTLKSELASPSPWPHKRLKRHAEVSKMIRAYNVSQKQERARLLQGLAHSNEEVGRLVAQVQELQGKTTSLEAQLEEANKGAAALRGNVERLEAEKKSLEAENTALEAEIKQRHM